MNEISDNEPLPAEDDENAFKKGEEPEGEGPTQPGLPVWLDHNSEESEPAPDNTDQDQPPSTASWLEEMRPSYDPNPTRPAQAQPELPELAGPLAGLRGVLSAQPDAIRSRKTVVFSEQLKITANQRAHADLLKSLIETEGVPRGIPQRKPARAEYFLRWAILLVLLLVLLWPALTGTQDMPLPVNQEETAELNRLVEQLPERAPVLVGFDYDPGLSAEVEAAASTVFDHLMLRGAYLTLVSTSPFGPVLAERFMREHGSAHNYTSGIHYVDLGYIPGGTVGLLNFVESPQRTLPYSLDGVAAWETAGHEALPPLQGVSAVEDFSMILVLVDDPDTARAWVEQLQIRLEGSQSLTSLGMVTSAQIEPVILPYYIANPRQVHGLVAGLRGGAAYSRLIDRPGQPRQFWDAYGVGMFAGALVILVGGLVYVLMPLIRRSAAVEGEGVG
jgi:hypothetical protein